jgi:YD repeat-containing protein
LRTFLFIAVAFPTFLVSFPVASRHPPAVPAATPLHKGSVDLATGLYVRVNEDLVVQGAPLLALRRTYLSGYRTAKEFGVGTTHSGEEYLIGDGEQFQWAALILASGTRINFKRLTPGTGLLNARYVHEESGGEWQGAELTWTLVSWAIKKRDGSLLVFRGCGQGSLCSIIQSTDAQGQNVYYRRNPAGRLLKMEAAADRWIAFDYDSAGRIERAHDNTSREVRYRYDARGRLEQVTGNDGIVRRYSYTDLDELESIEEPGTSITNTYVDGRVIRQTNWYPDRDPYIFDFKYETEGKRVYRTRSSHSDGTWREFAWDETKSSVSETVGRAGSSDPAFVMYERNPVSRAITGFTVSCRDAQGRPVRQSTSVRPGEEELLKLAFLRKFCS